MNCSSDGTYFYGSAYLALMVVIVTVLVMMMATARITTTVWTSTLYWHFKLANSPSSAQSI